MATKKEKVAADVAGSVEPEASATGPVASTTKAPKVDADRQARWDAFVAKAEEQATENGTLAIFNAQKERGEFDKIPDSFA